MLRMEKTGFTLYVPEMIYEATFSPRLVLFVIWGRDVPNEVFGVWYYWKRKFGELAFCYTHWARKLVSRILKPNDYVTDERGVLRDILGWGNLAAWEATVLKYAPREWKDLYERWARMRKSEIEEFGYSDAVVYWITLKGYQIYYEE